MPTAAVFRLASPFKHLLADAATAARTFRHLLRDLLRETTYLPDPWLRTYYRSYILKRYRAYLQEPPRTQQFAVHQAQFHTDLRRDEFLRRKQPFIRESAKQPERQHHLFIQARLELRRLARANLGHEKALWSVMCRAYGRSGERRFALLQKVWKSDFPENGEELAAILEAQRGALFAPANQLKSGKSPKHKRLDGESMVPGRARTLDQELWSVDSKATPKPPRPIPTVPELPAAVRALIRAQVAARADTDKVRLQPMIPEKNAWGRPLPVVRKRNIIRAWLLQLKNNIVAPLPDKEFSRLRDIVDARYEALECPKLDKAMPPIVKTRHYSSLLFQPFRRPVGTIRSHPKGLVRRHSPSNGKARQNFRQEDNPAVGARRVELTPNDEHSARAVTLNAETVERNMIGVRDAHYLTEKYLRRLYGRLLEITCQISEIEKGTVVVNWGKGDAEPKKVRQQSSDVEGRRKSPRSEQTPEVFQNEGAPSRRVSRDAWMFRMEDPMESGSGT